MCAKRFNPDAVHQSSAHPLRDFILQLPLLSITANSEIHYEQADPALLVQLADNGEIAMRTIQLGLSAIGLLLANSAPEVEANEFSGDSIEALGWLLAEWGEFAAVAHCISAGCRRQITDYRSGTIKVIPNVRP